MPPVWLLEADVFGTSMEPFKAEIRRRGMTCHVVRFQSLLNNPHDPLFRELDEEPCVLVQSSYGLLAYLRKRKPEWRPLGWCNTDNLACSVYSAYFGKYLFNSRYALLPAAEALRQQAWLFEAFGRDGKLFVRPDAADKRFTGVLMDEEQFTACLAFGRYNPEPLVLVATPRPIAREWRLVVSGSEVLAASRYRTGTEIDVDRGCPEPVQHFAERMLAEVRWRPDPIFVMDLCESAGQFYLLELNGFSGAGLYGCDPAPILERVTRLVSRADAGSPNLM